MCWARLLGRRGIYHRRAVAGIHFRPRNPAWGHAQPAPADGV